MFHISAPSTGCVYPLGAPQLGGSNGYSRSMFLIKMKNVYPCKPLFSLFTIGFVKRIIIRICCRYYDMCFAVFDVDTPEILLYNVRLDTLTQNFNGESENCFQ